MDNVRKVNNCRNGAVKIVTELTWEYAACVVEQANYLTCTLWCLTEVKVADAMQQTDFPKPSKYDERLTAHLFQSFY
jgi:hypothetical protein